jgi:hypothetical protein
MVRRALTACLQSSEQGVDGALRHNPQVICWPIWWDVVKTDQLTYLPILFTFLLKRYSFNPSLALQFIERGVVQLPFVLQEQDSNG